MAPRAATPRAQWTQAAFIAACGVAPDLDILVGRHSAETHSLGAAVLVASALALLRAPIGSTRLQTWVVACGAWMTHPLLDSLGTDHAAPFGIMAWWPLSHAYVLTGWEWFWPISRRWHDPMFWTQNLAAAAREVLMLGPVAAVSWWWAGRRQAARRQA